MAFFLPKNNSVFQSPSQDKVEAGHTNVLHKALLPFITVGRLVGIIHVEISDNVSNFSKNTIFGCLQPWLVLSVMLAEMATNMAMLDYSNVHGLDIKTISMFAVYNGRVSAMLVVIISGFKSRQWLLYSLEWRDINNMLLPYDRQIYRAARRIFLLMMLVVGSFEVVICCQNAIHITGKTRIIGITWYCLRSITTVIECCILSFYPFACAMLCRTLQFAFEDINMELQSMTSPGPISLRFYEDERWLRVLRTRHQKLSDFVSMTNKLLSPALLINLVSQTVAVCFGLKAFAVDKLAGIPSGIRYPVLMLGFSFVRFISLPVVCLAADRLAKEASHGLKVIYRNSNWKLSPESKFQLYLLNSKIANCPVEVTASGFARINNHLLVQILGIIATYCLVLVQQS